MESKITCISFSLFLMLSYFFLSVSAHSLTPDGEIFASASGRKLLQTIGKNVTVNKMVIVSPNGKGNFITIRAAVAAAPDYTAPYSGYYVIRVLAGVYQEYVTIPSSKSYVMIIGAGIKKTIITGDRSVGDGWTTYSSATFAVEGKGFVAVNIGIRNTAGAIKQQAVAVRNSADSTAFYKCSIEGYQATLYAQQMRQFYKQCNIYGTVDMIFGNAAAVFQNCKLYARLPLKGQFNTITAQARSDMIQKTGFSMQKCIIQAAPDLGSSNGTVKTFLGRPWMAYSRTVYLQSFLGSLIDPAGWAPWSGDFALNTLYYGEYKNTGPGSVTTNRVKWPGFRLINKIDAASFTVANFIQGNSWLWATGVPFKAGL